MINIKIDFPCSEKNINISQFIENDAYKNCKLHINSDITDADYWFIIDNPLESKTCKVAKENIYFLCAETFLPKGYYSDKTEFLSQFSKIYTCHDIFLDNVNYTLPFLPWMLNSGYHVNIFASDINFNDIVNLETNKTKILSMFCSSKTYNEHHSLRLRFAQKIKAHFKDKVDWFGGGINPINIKSEAILPYKYHLALENYSSINNITEKLYDSYLGLSYPIYYGAPNVTDYFPQNSLSQINIRDLKSSINIIEEVIENDYYTQNLDSLKQAKSMVLEDYNVFKRIVNIALSEELIKNKSNITINPIKVEENIKPINLLGKCVRKVGQKIIDLSYKK